MAMPQHMDKLILSIIACFVAVVGCSLILAGSFIPLWARPLNTSHTDANSTYSLWGREDCYGIICTTKIRMEEHKLTRRWQENGQWVEETTIEEVKVPIVTCVEANYCNTTWLEDIEFDQVPSLIYVARAFIIPSLATGALTILLYIVKIILLVLRPHWRRLYVKAAYLTFSAIAGVSSGLAAILFSVMLEKEAYELLWAPALPGCGSFLYLSIAIGGYLSWRNHSTDDEFDDRSEFSDRTSNIYEFSSSGKQKEHHHVHHLKGPGVGKKYQRSVSNQSGKSDIV